MNLLRLKTLPLLVAAAMSQLPLHAQASPACALGDARQFSPIRELCPVADGLARIQVGYRWGFVDTSGKLVIAPQFQDLKDFSEGHAAAQVDDKWGLIDKQGRWVLPPKLDELDAFSNGLARASLDGKDGYIDASGKWVIAPQFQSGGDFSASTAVAYDAGYNHFLIDRSGRIIKRFPREVSLDRDISGDGLIKATLRPPAMLVNVDGRRLPFPKEAESYEDGVFLARSSVKRGKDDVDVYGLMDMTGKWVLPAQYHTLRDWRNQLAIAAPLLADHTAPKQYGLMDRKGRFIVKPEYEDFRTFGTDFYFATRPGGAGKTEMLDARGKLLFTFNCDQVEGGAAVGAMTVMKGCATTWLVHRKDGLVKTISGDMEVKSEGDHVMLTLQRGEDSDHVPFEIYSGAGKRVAAGDPKHAFLSQHFDSIELVRGASRALPLAYFGNFANGLVGFLTRDYRLVTRPDWEYDSVLLHYGIGDEPVEAPLVMKGKQGFGAVDMQGNWVIAPKFSALTHFQYGLAFGTINDEDKVVVDASGKVYTLPDGLHRLERVNATTLAGETQQGKVTFDLKTGKLTPQAELDDSGSMEGGLTPASINGKWGLTDAAGSWALAPSLKNQPKPLVHQRRLAGWVSSDEGLLGLLDAQGRELAKPRYTGLTVNDETGMLMAEQDGYLNSVLSAAGKQVLAPIDGHYEVLGDGWFKAVMKEQHGLINEKGDWVVKPGRIEFTLDTRYFPGVRPYTVADGGKLVDFAGRVSTRAAPLALSTAEPSQWWWKDGEQSGETVFYGFDFKERVRLAGMATESAFAEGVIPFYPAAPEHEGKLALADDKGKVIGMYRFKSISAMTNGMAKVSQEVALKPAGKGQRGEPVTRYGFLNRAGKLAVPVMFEQAGDFAGKRATVVIDSGLAMIDDSGKILLQGAWQCGRVPVLMDARKNVLWPEQARAVTSCKR